jgi:hypothetical protein
VRLTQINGLVIHDERPRTIKSRGVSQPILESVKTLPFGMIPAESISDHSGEQ